MSHYLELEGRRALVFSQFVELLTLWRADLDGEKIAYEYLDGSSTKRDDIVARFALCSADASGSTRRGSHAICRRRKIAVSTLMLLRLRPTFSTFFLTLCRSVSASAS